MYEVNPRANRLASTLTAARELQQKSSLMRVMDDYTISPCHRLIKTEDLAAGKKKEAVLSTAIKEERRFRLPAKQRALKLSAQPEILFQTPDALNESLYPERKIFQWKSDYLRTQKGEVEDPRRRGRNNGFERRRKRLYPVGSASYESDKLHHLELLTPNALLNDFRSSSHNNTHRSLISKRRIPSNDAIAFQDEITVRRVGSLAACFPTSSSSSSSPSSLLTYKQVVQSTLQLAQREILSFDTRIVDTASLIRAVQDSRNPSCGLPTVFSLCRRCRAAALLNVSAAVLSAAQCVSIFLASLPWLPETSLRRLILAYDPDRTGFVPFMQLLLPVVTHLAPALNNLVAFIDVSTHGTDFAPLALLLGVYYDLFTDVDRQSSSTIIGDGREVMNLGSSYIEENCDTSLTRRHITGIQSTSFPRSQLNIKQGIPSQGMSIVDAITAVASSACDRFELVRIQTLASTAIVTWFTQKVKKPA